ncbi:MAG: pyridoxine 5-phosphate synthase [Verrucomicrobiales bacterium]|jgi:pyridoxine 5-phosphate synthase
MSRKLKLGVNIDHVATLRQARYATMLEAHNAEPNLLQAARECEAAGADSITIHLREDQRHIQKADVYAVRKAIGIDLNLELGATAEIVTIACDAKPDFCCLVPENRQEITTEGGLDVVANRDSLRATVQQLQGAGAKISLFIDPDLDQVAASAELGAEMIELHTGAFANGAPEGDLAELARIRAAAERGHELGLQINAGHGINLTNLPTLLSIPNLAELNIGHHLVSRAVFIGLKQSVSEMIEAMSGYDG